MESNDEHEVKCLTNEEQKLKTSNKSITKVSLPLYLLTVVFAWGSWIDINAIFSQYSIISSILPESGEIGSYLAMLIQIANIFPVVYVIGRKLKPNIFHERPVTIIILSIGAISLLALAFTYDKAIVLKNGKAISLPMLLLCFVLASVDTTSTLAFLPYMSLFPHTYLSAFFLGQSLSSLIPSILSLIQGIDYITIDISNVYPKNTIFCNDKTRQTSNPTSNTTTIAVGKRFNSTIFYLIMTFLMLCSLAAFLLLSYAKPFVIRMKKSYREYLDERISQPRSLQISNLKNKLSNEWKTIENFFICHLFSLALVSFISNGVIVQIASLLGADYGYTVVLLCSNLSLVSSALTSIVLLWKSFSNHFAVLSYAIVSALLAILLIVMVTLPRYGIKIGNSISTPLLIISFILLGHVCSSVRQIVCTVANSFNTERMLMCSICIQFGSFLGALVMFLPISVFCVFR